MSAWSNLGSKQKKALRTETQPKEEKCSVSAGMKPPQEFLADEVYCIPDPPATFILRNVKYN